MIVTTVLHKPSKILLSVLRFARDFPRRVRSNPARHTNPNTADYFSDRNFPLVSDPELGVWNRPNLHFIKTTLLKNGGRLCTEVWFDRHGARVAGAGAELPSQPDILVVGESNSWGQGVTFDDTYAAILSKSLGMSVGNLALINSNGVQNLVTVKRFISRKPRLIVFGLWEEHFWSNVTRCANIDSPVCLGRPVIRRGLGGRLRVSFPRRTDRALHDYKRWYIETAQHADPSIRRDFYWTARLMLQETLNNYAIFRRDGGPWPQLACTPQWVRCVAAVKFVNEEMQKAADSVGAKLIVIYLPFFFGEEIMPPPEEIADHAKNCGMMFLSMDEKWRARKASGIRFYFDGDLHLNPLGHRDVAEHVINALRHRSWG